MRDLLINDTQIISVLICIYRVSICIYPKILIRNVVVETRISS